MPLINPNNSNITKLTISNLDVAFEMRHYMYLEENSVSISKQLTKVNTTITKTPISCYALHRQYRKIIFAITYADDE